MSRLFKPEEVKYIRENARGIGNKELTDSVNELFGTYYTVEQIKSFKQNHHISSGLTGHFTKGHEPFNKGAKGQYTAGSEKTWFKKGHCPINHKEVGSERIDKDGYVMVKVAEPRKWRLKHRLVWEQNYGPIPKSHSVIFLDGNRQNCVIENLRLVSRSALARINQNHLLTGHAEINDTAIVLGNLIVKAGEARKRRENHERKPKTAD